jgi:hypothetical protein
VRESLIIADKRQVDKADALGRDPWDGQSCPSIRVRRTRLSVPQTTGTATPRLRRCSHGYART